MSKNFIETSGDILKKKAKNKSDCCVCNMRVMTDDDKMTPRMTAITLLMPVLDKALPRQES